MESKEQRKTLVDATSLATKYEVLLAEQGQSGLTQDRMILVFQVLDELIPNLGIFMKIVQLIRDEMYDAVFSYEHTATPTGGLTKSKKGFIQRVPYFSLVNQVYTERHQEADNLREQLETVKTKLFDKHKDFEKAQQDIADLNTNIDELNGEIESLNLDIAEKNEEINSLERTLSSEQQRAANTNYQLNCDIDELKDELHEAKDEIKDLNKFKKGYDDMYHAFLDETLTVTKNLMISGTVQKPVISTKRANFISNLESARKLEQQILTVMNVTIEEFDKELEMHKNELAEKPTENVDELTSQMNNQHIEQAGQELWQTQERFKRTIDNINEELGLIRQHILMMEEQLQILEENKPTMDTNQKDKVLSTREAARRASVKEFDDMKRAVISGRPHSTGKDSVLSAGLEDEDEDDNKEDPFIPHERIFSKYSAMMFTSSNGGRTWHEFKDASYCMSCGDKTVLCPHKTVLEEKVFIMPHEVSHIKVTRPRVRINREVIDQLVKPITADTSVYIPEDKYPFSRQSTSMSTPGGGSEAPSAMGTTEAHMKHSFIKLWEDYKTRTTLERLIPRPLAKDRCISVIEQFYSKMVWQDQFSSEEDGYFSILDNLYRFMTERYLKPDITYLATHDLLSAVIEYSGSSRTIQVFGHLLIGNLDAAAFRYILLVSDLIQLVDWQIVEDYRAFASVIYPFLGEDDLESLQMGYTSFSEHKISRELVYEYLLYMILKYREPRFLESEARLILHPGQEAGILSDEEFNEAIDHVIPLSNEQLRKRLFWETEASMKSEGLEGVVTVMRLAQVTGYLALLQIIKLVKESLADTVQKARISQTENIGGKPAIPPVGDGKDFQLLTMSSIKGLALNVAKREKGRKAQEQSDEDFFS